MSYEVWIIRCDIPSEWDGGSGECVTTTSSSLEAEELVKSYQKGGHAVWIKTVEI
jgi:hypothetical protein